MRGGLAHILANGSLDPQWNASLAAQSLVIGPTLVRAIAVVGNSVIVGGDFGTVNGQTRIGLAAVDAQIGALQPLAVTLPIMPFVAVTVNSLAVDGTKLYFTGNFLSVDGVPRQNAAAVDLITGMLLPWDPAVGGPGAMVQHVAAVPGGVLLGGTFSTAGGLPRANVALVDPLSASAVPGWNPGADAAVATSLLDGTTLYLGGEFAQVGGMPRSQVAALDVGTGALLPWAPAAFGVAPGTILRVDRLAATSTALYCGGVFNTVATLSRNQVVALDRATGQPTPWDPAPAPGLTVSNPTIAALHVAGSELFLAGGFQGLAAAPRQGLAAIDVVNRAVLPWSPSINGTVRDFVFSGDTVYICGSFSAVQGQPRTGIAALSRSTGALLPWDPAPNTTPFFGVTAIATDGNVIYAGGMFTAIGGQPRNYIAALDPVTGLAPIGDRLLVAGSDILAPGSGVGVYDLVSVATVLDLAPPCTTATAPRLASTLPTFGTTKVYSLSQAPPLAAATFFLSLEPPSGPPTMIAGCPIFLDLPSTVILTSFTTTATGAFSISIAIPVASSLADIRFRSVVAVQEPGGALGGLFQLSNTLEITLGF